MDDANQKKKMLLTGIILTSIVFAIVLIILIVLMSQESKKTKIQFGDTVYKTQTINITANDGEYQQVTMSVSGQNIPILLITPQGKTYYCIETISKISGYKYNNGEYGSEIDESKDKCYIDNGGEYVTFIANSNQIRKNEKELNKYEGELKEAKDESANSLDEEYFIIENSVIQFEDKLYASDEAINKGLNMSITAEGSTICFYTLDNLVNNYSSSLSSNGYTLTQNFKNQRALCNGYAVVGKDQEYGVVDLRTNKEIISLKYDSVEYIQSIGEFIVSSKSQFGMIKPGEDTPTIKLIYESIALLNAENKLYIVEYNEKYGVINADGKEVIPTEYDQIGLNDISAYKSQGITDKYVIANACIPVKRNNSYGLYSLDGKVLASTRFSEIGCENPAKIIGDTSLMPTLTVPLSDTITSVVFAQKNAAGITSYGLINPNDGTIIHNAYYTAIYYRQYQGKITYFFDKQANNELIRLEDLLETNITVQEALQQTKTQEELEAEAKKEQNNINRTSQQTSYSTSEYDEYDEDNEENIEEYSE